LAETGNGTNGNPVVPPASDAFDPAQLTPEAQANLLAATSLVNQALDKIGEIIQPLAYDPDLLPAGLAFLIKEITPTLLRVVKAAIATVQPLATLLVGAGTQLFEPIAAAFGELTTAYVQIVGKTIAEGEDGRPGMSASATALGANYAFDNIVAPIAFIASGNDPTKAGAGTANIQSSLGAIVSIHLMTWVCNVVANLTGLGTLKFMNSFNDVILAAMNARGMSRLAMRPYMETFMVQPATNDLNSAWPNKPLPESAAMKAYIRGALDSADTIAALRKLGYNEAYQAQWLSDASKYMTDENVGLLVNLGWWTDDQATQYLQQQGWPATIVGTVLNLAKLTRVIEIQHSMASYAEKLLITGKMTEEDFTSLLKNLDFSDTEIQALTLKALLQMQATKSVTYGQVVAMYKEGIVDLSYVQDWLEQEGYSAEDVANLVLLDFTQATERNARRATLAAQKRVASDKALQAQQKALAAAEALLAQHEADLAAKLSALADIL